MRKTKETEHYIFNYQKGSLAEKDIESIINLQENCYDYICKVLNVRMKRKIKYFLCESPEEVGRAYGDNEPANGFAKFPDEIYAVYNEKVKCTGPHEDAHIISYNALGNPKQPLLREGLAMFFDEVWFGIPNKAWVKVFIAKNLYKNLSLLKETKRFYDLPETITYPESGAFVHYLISVFGIEKFKEFYKTAGSDFDKSFFETFGISLNEFEDRMVRYIGNIAYNKSICKTVEDYLKKENLLK